MKKYFLISVLLSFVLVYGCGNKNENTADKKNDNTSEQVKTDDKKIDTSGKKNETAGDTKSANELGITEGIPTNYPADLPQPKNSKCMGSLATSDGTAVTFESTETARNIFDFYKEQMKKSGFEMGDGGETLASDQGGLIGWKKDNREVGLMVSFDKETKKAQVVITYK
jgi:hypothetical protein